MSLSDVRQIANEQRHALRGTPMVATVPHGTPVSLSVVWDAYELDPVGRSRQLRRSFWVNTADLAAAPIGTLFVGPEATGGEDKTWRVDQTTERESGRYQVLVTEVE